MRHFTFYRTRWSDLVASLRPSHASLTTLAIETSCDDTSVAILEKRTYGRTGLTGAKLHFHKKVTANNLAFNGVHPLVSLQSHQENLAALIDEALEHLPPLSTDRALQQNLHDDSNDIDEDHLILHDRLWTAKRKIPDFISVTRGPGMRSNLATGIDTAKGLAVAWQKPLIGVHHMQAHALTPRLVCALETWEDQSLEENQSENVLERKRPIQVNPAFPFLSVLVSGGHTLLINSTSLTNHDILAATLDIAVGECLDKIARIVLPSEYLQQAQNTMYGALLEDFVFAQKTERGLTKTYGQANHKNRTEAKSKSMAAASTSPTRFEGPSAQEVRVGVPQLITAAEYCINSRLRYNYRVPKNQEEAVKRNISNWGWSLVEPLSRAQGGLKAKNLEMSFSGLVTAVESIVRCTTDKSTGKLTKCERLPESVSCAERKDMALHAMRIAFEHLCGRIVLALDEKPSDIIVMAGGVASNSFLREILANILCANGYTHVGLCFPPPSLCCDNAAMIAWAGMEMFQTGARSQFDIRAVRKWPLDQLLSPPIDKRSF